MSGMKITLGEPKYVGKRGDQLFGIKSYICNTIDNSTFTSDDGEVIDLDCACICLCRSSFGNGKMFIIPYMQMWMLLDETKIDGILTAAAEALIGAAYSTGDLMNIGNLVMDSIDPMHTHPPESTIEAELREQKWLERSGVVVKADDKIILDTR